MSKLNLAEAHARAISSQWGLNSSSGLNQPKVNALKKALEIGQSLGLITLNKRYKSLERSCKPTKDMQERAVKAYAEYAGFAEHQACMCHALEAALDPKFDDDLFLQDIIVSLINSGVGWKIPACPDDLDSLLAALHFAEGNRNHG